VNAHRVSFLKSPKKCLTEIILTAYGKGVKSKNSTYKYWIVVDMMLHTYYQNALKFIRMYGYDAGVNNLSYDLSQEEATARHFRAFLWTAWEQSKGPHEAKLIPSWNRVRYSLPEIYSHLLEAVETDNG
jgi:hypothetical protein